MTHSGNEDMPPAKEGQLPNTLWYYEHLGERIGPVTEESIKLLLKNRTIQEDCLVWNKTFGRNWNSIVHTELSDGPPPLPHVTAELSQDDILIARIADYQRISGILWIVIGIIQVLLIYTVIAGVWNIFAGVSRIRMVDRIKRREANIPTEFESVTQLVIIGVINLVFGGLIGLVFVGFDFFIRDKILSNRHLFGVGNDNPDAYRRTSSSSEESLPVINDGKGSPAWPVDEAGIVASASQNLIEALERIAKLRDAGVLTDEEFASEKKKIVG